MNELLKQRLVGALILLALGVVFWPIIFVQHDQHQVAEPASAPPPPAVSTEPVPTPDATGLRASPSLESIEGTGEAASSGTQQPSDTSASENLTSIPPAEPAVLAAGDANMPSETTLRQEAPQALQMDRSGVPVAWTLQVATVSAAEKAEELRRKLLEMDQKAYVATVSSGGKTLFRVCIGPKFERAELEKLQAVINAKFGVNTMVVRYVP